MKPILWIVLLVALAEWAFMIWILVDDARYPWWFYAFGVIYKYKNYIGSPKQIDWSFKSPALPKPKGPNIIFIIVDDMGINDISGGNHGVTTPHIDSIFQNGIKFTNSYAGHATCAPARAAIFTGRYPTRFGYEYTPVPPQFSYLVKNAKTSKDDEPYIRTGMYHEKVLPLIPPVEEMRVPFNETFISQKLKKIGYDTAYVGKWHLGEIPGALPEDRGFDKFIGFLNAAGLYAPLGDPSLAEAYVLGESTDDMIRVFASSVVRDHEGNRFYPGAYQTDYFAQQAVQALDGHNAPRQRCREEKRDNCDDTVAPLFLTVSFNAPHNPYQALLSDYNDPGVTHITNHRQRVYGGMMKSLDRGVGQILEAVVRNDMYEDTLIIFTSDNGGLTYTNLKQVNSPFRGGKASFFEGGVRVPLLIQWPAVIPTKSDKTCPSASGCGPAVVYDEMVSHMDIFATIEAAAGIKSDLTLIDGVNLLPYIEQAARRNDVSAFGAASSQLPRPHEYLYWRSGHYIALRYHNWKLHFSQRPHKLWLFDLSLDPTEQNNLAENVPPAGIDWLLMSQSTSSAETNNALLSAEHRTNFTGPITREQTYSRFVNYVDAKDPKGLEKTLALNAQCQSRVLQSIVSSTHNATVSEYIRTHYPALSVHPENSLSTEGADLTAILCALASKLVKVHATEMVEPIWPSLSEGLIAIDKYYVLTLEDEYVYWPN